MNRNFLHFVFIFAVCHLLICVNANAQQEKLPEVPREFRAAWVATVRNIDFPTKPNLTTREQKQELITLLDRAQELKLNAILLQVRPMCDAFYQSRIEGWSRFLTGEHGRGPKPFYDPLKFAIEEAHKRGLLVHAWFNPYRANDMIAKEGNRRFKLKPEYVKKYGEYYWLDPGERVVQDYSLAVVLDVVKRYDVDGVVFDDYFYPYPIDDATTKTKVPFPDDESFAKYKGKLARDDWRRDNVNKFIKRVSVGIKRIKPSVMFGVSPFGIYRPEPPRITGFDAYAELYADSLKWLREGILDYFSPQLYWTMTAQGHDFGMLFDWWKERNKLKRHIWVSTYTSKYDAAEIGAQIETTRTREKETGVIHFSMKSLMNENSEFGKKLKKEIYKEDAIAPESPWIKTQKPQPPIVSVKKNSKYKKTEIIFHSRNKEKVFRWIVYVWPASKIFPNFSLIILEGEASGIFDPYETLGSKTGKVAVVAVNRFGQMSKPTFVNIK